jgi:hypothetical protein
MYVVVYTVAHKAFVPWRHRMATLDAMAHEINEVQKHRKKSTARHGLTRAHSINGRRYSRAGSRCDRFPSF